MDDETSPHGPLDELAIKVFLGQVHEQCRHVLTSWWLMNAPEFHDLTWYAVTGLVTVAANISKCLWGQGGKLEKERAPIRERIGVENDSPLRLTAMRNNFEHIDQRIDEWLRSSGAHTFADANIGISLEGVIDRDNFRSYDPATGIVGFWGETFDAGEIAREVQRIFRFVNREASRPRLGPPPPGAPMPPPRTSGGGR